MEQGQAQRILRRLSRWARTQVGDAGATDPTTGELFGSLTLPEATASGRASIGARSYGEATVHVGRGETARLRVGAYCSIAAGVQFLVGGNHRTDWVSTYPFRVLFGLPGAWEDGHPRPERDIEIGNDVWIGTEAMVLPGTRIGDGAVVGARAVVSGQVRPYAIVAGVPAKEIRRRFTDRQVEELLAVRWWDWPEERVLASVPLLSNGDVDGFLRSARASG